MLSETSSTEVFFEVLFAATTEAAVTSAADFTFEVSTIVSLHLIPVIIIIKSFKSSIIVEREKTIVTTVSKLKCLL